MTEWRDIPVASLELSVRTYNSITRKNIRTLGELYDAWNLRSKAGFIKDFDGIGVRSYREVEEVVLPFHRMQLAPPSPPPADPESRVRNLYWVTYGVSWYSDDELKTGLDSMLVETWSEAKAREIVEVAHGKKVESVKLAVEDV